MKNVELCGKTSKFLPERCLLIFYVFYSNEKESNQEVFLIKYVENEISNYLLQRIKRRRSKNIIQLQKHHF